MATTLVFTGDTKTVRGHFTNKVEEDAPVGDLVDADGTVTATIYDAEWTVVETGTATRDSVGVYTYDWTAPNTPGIYWVEFKGFFNTNPELARRKFSVKFKGNQ